MTTNTLSWIHVSDRHISAATKEDSKRQDDQLIASIERECKRRKLTPSLLFFTGDLSNGERPNDHIRDQLVRGEQLLETIRRAVPTEIRRDRTYVIPGNHEVNRTRTTLMNAKFLWEAANAEHVNTMMRQNGHEWKTFMQPLDDYKAFLLNTPHYASLANEPYLSYAKVIDGDAARIGILGLNSAWPCCADRKHNGAEGLITGLRIQIDSLYDQIKDCDVRIALVHHPDNWYSPAERDDIWRDRIYADFHFCLHGHEHTDPVGQRARCYAIAAGAMYQGSRNPAMYNICQLDFAERSISVFPMSYNPSDGGAWVASGRRGAEDGIIRMPFPDHLRRRGRQLTSRSRFRPRRASANSQPKTSERKTHRNITRRPFKMLAIDLDGTLLKLDGAIYSWAILWRELGYSEEFRKAGHNMYRRRILTYPTWCDYCLNFFRYKQLTRHQIIKFAKDNMKLQPDAIKLLRLARESGMRVSLVSGGIDTVLDYFIPSKLFAFDDVHINRFRYDKDNELMAIEPTAYDFDGKREIVEGIARSRGIDLADVVYVGDALNDASLCGKVGLTIAMQYERGSPTELSHVADIACASLKEVVGRMIPPARRKS